MSTTAPPEHLGGRVLTGQLHRVAEGRRKTFAAQMPEPSARRPAGLAITLARAHKISEAIDRGELRSQADAARKLGLTRARLSQILALTCLAPDLQEEILFLEANAGPESLSERALRNAVRVATWTEQRTTTLSE
jgi:hypothetical protein